MSAEQPERSPTTDKTLPGVTASAGANTEVEKADTTGRSAQAHQDDKQSPAVKKQTRLSAAWVALAIALVVLVLLLIFILQNNNTVVVRYFGARGELPLGVLLLFAAAGGALLVVILGAARMFQIHWLARRDRRSAGAAQSGSGPRRAGSGAKAS